MKIGQQSPEIESIIPYLYFPSYRGSWIEITPLSAMSQAYAFASRPLHILNVDREPCIAFNSSVPSLLLDNKEAREVHEGQNGRQS